MNRPLPRRTQAQRTEASDKAMYKAAIKLIARDGSSKMTFAKLGAEAGVSRGLPGYRFGSKSNLLQAITERILELWEERVIKPAHADDGGLDNLKLMARLYLEAVVAGSDLMLAQYRLMNESYSSSRELRPIFQEHDLKVRRSIVNGLTTAQRAGEIEPSTDLESFAVLFLGMLRGITLQYFISSTAFDIEAAYARIEETCEMHLSPRAS